MTATPQPCSPRAEAVASFSLEAASVDRGPSESGVSFNYPGWSNEEYDSKLRAAAETTDLAARAAILAEAEQIFLDNVPALPILYYSSRALVSDKVSGWEDNILDNHATRWLTLAN
jgi:oligopeptide transport system substrate-binding protein